MIMSPEADFRRKQIIKFKNTGLGGETAAYDYGRQLGQRSNKKRGRHNHESRFP